VLLPGLLDTSTARIEHPWQVEQRLLNNIRIVGVEHVTACTDCSFSTAAGAVNVVEELVWKKMRCMVEGAKIAGREATPGVAFPTFSPPKRLAGSEETTAGEGQAISA